MMRNDSWSCGWLAIVFWFGGLGIEAVAPMVGFAETMDTVDPEPVKRTSGDRDADLVEALIGLGRFDEAINICQTQLASSPTSAAARGSSDPLPSSQTLSRARWTVRLSEVLMARQSGRGTFDDAGVEQIVAPVQQWIDQNPEHPYRLMVQAQVVATARAAARAAVLAAAISPNTDSSETTSARQSASNRLIRALTATTQLADQVADQRISLDAGRDPAKATLAADLNRLQQELQVERVAMALMQTELFASGSNDRIAAATRAERMAEQAIIKLPNGSTAQTILRMYRVDSILRGDQPNRAEIELATLNKSAPSPASPELLALRIRVALARGDRSGAETILNDYFGSDPTKAPRSIEMDLARLQFFLDAELVDRVGGWLDEIEARGGPYARRRAEAISLSRLAIGSTMKDADGNGSRSNDAAMVAVQGRDWLRRGDPVRAATLLSAAARADDQGPRAMKHAGEAAAAWIAAGQASDAANVLSDIAIAHPSQEKASVAQLQAAVLIAQSDLAATDKVDRLQSLLTALVDRWPASESAIQGRVWLIKLYRGQSDLLSAAEVTLRVPPSQASESDVTQAKTVWRDTFARASSTQIASDDVTKRFLDAAKVWMAHPTTRSAIVRIGATSLDRSDLKTMVDALDPSATGDRFSSDDPFVDALVRFRIDPENENVPPNPPKAWASPVLSRLMRDGRNRVSSRVPIAKTLDTWDLPDDDVPQRVERLIWVGKDLAAIAECQRWIARAGDDQESKASSRIRQAAGLCGESDDPQAKRQAIDWWDKIAAGSPVASDAWHQAKQAAMRLLVETGQPDVAAKRAKYVLLTVSTIDEEQRRIYQKFAR